MQEIRFGNHNVQNIPKPTEIARKVLSNAAIKLPKTLPVIQANVQTKKNLIKSENVNNFKTIDAYLRLNLKG